jgi:hypothetical protein
MLETCIDCALGVLLVAELFFKFQIDV